jgi:hypothetical protein
LVRVPAYRLRSLGCDSRSYQIFSEIVGVEWVPLSLVSINEVYLKEKVEALA